MKRVLALFVAFIFLFSVAVAVSNYDIAEINITKGEINSIDVIIEPFGMVNGSIVFKVGGLLWFPEEIWLLPSNASENFEEVFKFENKYLSMNSSTCKTNIYFNESFGYAFKVTTSQINNGVFCALAYDGTYKILVTY